MLAGAIAFLFQMTIWSVYAPAMSFGLLTPICTADGVRLILPDQIAATSDDSQTDQAMVSVNDCPLCLMVLGLTAPPMALTTPMPAFVRLHEAPRLPGGLIAAGWHLATLKARAPPVTAA